MPGFAVDGSFGPANRSAPLKAEAGSSAGGGFRPDVRPGRPLKGLSRRSPREILGPSRRRPVARRTRASGSRKKKNPACRRWPGLVPNTYLRSASGIIAWWPAVVRTALILNDLPKYLGLSFGPEPRSPDELHRGPRGRPVALLHAIRPPDDAEQTPVPAPADRPKNKKIHFLWPRPRPVAPGRTPATTLSWRSRSSIWVRSFSRRRKLSLDLLHLGGAPEAGRSDKGPLAATPSASPGPGLQDAWASRSSSRLPGKLPLNVPEVPSGLRRMVAELRVKFTPWNVRRTGKVV